MEEILDLIEKHADKLNVSIFYGIQYGAKEWDVAMWTSMSNQCNVRFSVRHMQLEAALTHCYNKIEKYL